MLATPASGSLSSFVWNSHLSRRCARVTRILRGTGGLGLGGPRPRIAARRGRRRGGLGRPHGRSIGRAPGCLLEDAATEAGSSGVSRRRRAYSRGVRRPRLHRGEHVTERARPPPGMVILMSRSTSGAAPSVREAASWTVTSARARRGGSARAERIVSCCRSLRPALAGPRTHGT